MLRDLKDAEADVDVSPISLTRPNPSDFQKYGNIDRSQKITTVIKRASFYHH